MKKFFSNAYASVKQTVSKCGKGIKCMALTGAAMVLGAVDASAQALAGTGYDAGTSALEDVAEENAFWLNHTHIKYDKMNIKLKKTRYK